MPGTTAAPPLGGVIETALYVDDLARSGDFYEAVFGFDPLMADDRMRAYSVSGRQVLLLFRKGDSVHPTETPGGAIPPHDGNGRLHLAFAVASADLPAWEARLAECGIALESKVSWERGGHSLYFRDPDEHLVELITPGCWAIY